MSEPTTAAGRDMVARYALSQPDPGDLSRFTYDIARIEAEAARDARPTILEAVDLIAANYPNPAQVRDRLLDALSAEGEK